MRESEARALAKADPVEFNTLLLEAVQEEEWRYHNPPPNYLDGEAEIWALVDRIEEDGRGWIDGFQLSNGEVGQEHEGLSAEGGWGATFDCGYGNETFSVATTRGLAISLSILKTYGVIDG